MFRKIKLSFLLWILCARGIVWAAAPAAPTLDEYDSMHCANNLVPVGVTGIMGVASKAGIVVDSVQDGAPASGKVHKGDMILGVNGKLLQEQDPYVFFGTALTDAESSDGVLKFEVKPSGNGAQSQVTINVPVLGPYSKTFPLNCAKTKEIIRRAAEYYSGADQLSKGNHQDGIICLFLLSTGEEKYVQRVKQYFARFLKPDGSVTGLGDMTWDNGFNGVACAEYYLRTGDRSVLPILQYYCDDAKRRQLYNSGWGHWGTKYGPAYEKGGGLMNPAGNPVLLTLVMSKMCGVEVDEKTLEGALRFFYRFAGHGTFPIADQRAWQTPNGSVDRTAATAAVMHIGSLAKGDTSIYRKAKEYLVQVEMTSRPTNVWELAWYNATAPFRMDNDLAAFQKSQQNFRWAYDLYRQPSGAFTYPLVHAPMSDISTGASLVLGLTAPLRNLFISGAPRSKYAKEFTLPGNLWGNAADLAFLDSKPAKDFSKYGEAEPACVAARQLAFGGRVTPADIKNVQLDAMLKNVRHVRCEFRTAAANDLWLNGHFEELEKLLRDPDPRLRRAALDGITGYAPWFEQSSCRRKTVEFTPGMLSAITAIMNNPDESWYVLDGAMMALGYAPADTIKQSIPRIRPWLNHRDWWMRDSAFTALMGLQADRALFAQCLPELINAMIKEECWNPRYRMVQQLKAALEKFGAESPEGKLMRDGFARATTETVILEDRPGWIAKSKGGKESVLDALQTSLRFAPQDAATLAGLLAKSGRVREFDTTSLMDIVKDFDGGARDRFVGLYPALEKVPAQEKGKLVSALYDTYRPELIERLKQGRYEKAGGGELGRLLDVIVELTQLKKSVEGWQALGVPKPEERVWRYMSAGATRNPQRIEHPDLPAGTEKWFAEGFADAQWQSGRMPIGIGEFKPTNGHNGFTMADKNFMVPNRSVWGSGQFVLARTTITLSDTDFDYFRLRILANGGHAVYLNGKKIREYWHGYEEPLYQVVMLDRKTIASLLRKGDNTIAVLGSLATEKNKKSAGQIDVYLEGLKTGGILDDKTAGAHSGDSRSP